MTKIDYKPQLDYNNVLIRPKRSTLISRSQVDLNRTFKFSQKDTSAKSNISDWTGVPIIAANMDTTGTFEMYNVLSKYKIITAMNKFYDLKDYQQACSKRMYTDDGETVFSKPGLDPDLFMVSTGISDADYEKLTNILDTVSCNWICIDIANGYIKALVDFCLKVRQRYPNKRIVAGNVATREMVEELILNGGVDVVKIGIGPGSACTTRLKTGVGVPQLSAVMECADAAHGVGGRIIADGGITCPGDVSKAFGGGADFVMIGGQFADSIINNF